MVTQEQSKEVKTEEELSGISRIPSDLKPEDIKTDLEAGDDDAESKDEEKEKTTKMALMVKRVKK